MNPITNTMNLVTMIVQTKKVLGKIWNIARSDEAASMLKASVALIGFVHAVEEMRKARRRIGFIKR